MYRAICLAVVLAFLSGCGVVDNLLDQLLEGLRNRASESGSAKLIPFESEQEMVDYFSGQVESRNDRFFGARSGLQAIDQVSAEDSSGTSGDGGQAPPPTANLGGDEAAAPSDSDFSETTTQVQGVDEADVVKTDGTHLYIIDGGTLRIVSAAPADQLAELSTVQLEGSGRNIFLHDGKVIALTETGFFFSSHGGGVAILEPAIDFAAPDVEESAGSDDDTVSVDATETPGSDAVEPFEDSDPDDAPTFDLVGPGIPIEPEFNRPQTHVTVIDVSVPDAPVVLSTTNFDGTPSASRLIDGVLHLVVSNFQNYYLDILPRLGQPDVETASINATAVLPAFQRTDAAGETTDEGSLLTWRDMFRPTDPDGFGIVTLVSLDVDADAAFSAVGIVAEPGQVFSSLSAMYLTDTEFNFFSDTRATTDIYKFDYVGRGAVPGATGSVPGRVLNQYSMDEHAGNLRVATTTTDVGGFRFVPANNVFVLAESGGELDIIGSLTDIAPGETIQSARFMGDRGYLVTFERIDPFFTLDLSDPTAPVLVGELKVPGFSTFIVPIDENHLLTVGQYIPENEPFFQRGVQLSIFDVTQFDQPQLTATAVLGEDTGASSEALFNPKAFTYFAEQGLVALPLSIYDDFIFFDDFIDIGIVVTDSDDGATEGSAGEGEAGADSGVAEPTEPVEPDDPVEPDEPVGIAAPSVPGGFEGVVVFSVDIDTGFEEMGRISTRFEDAGLFYASFARGVFIGDNIFAVTNNGIRGGPTADLTTQPFELMFD